MDETSTIRLIEWDHTGIPDRATRRDCTLAEAAIAMELDWESIAWAIEEYGRCDTESHTAWDPESPDETEPSTSLEDCQ